MSGTDVRVRQEMSDLPPKRGRRVLGRSSESTVVCALTSEVLRQLLLQVAFDSDLPVGRGFGGERFLVRGVTARDCSRERFAELRKWGRRLAAATAAVDREICRPAPARPARGSGSSR